MGCPMIGSAIKGGKYLVNIFDIFIFLKFPFSNVDGGHFFVNK